MEWGNRGKGDKGSGSASREGARSSGNFGTRIFSATTVQSRFCSHSMPQLPPLDLVREGNHPLERSAGALEHLPLTACKSQAMGSDCPHNHRN